MSTSGPYVGLLLCWALLWNLPLVVAVLPRVLRAWPVEVTIRDAVRKRRGVVVRDGDDLLLVSWRRGDPTVRLPADAFAAEPEVSGVRLLGQRRATWRLPLVDEAGLPYELLVSTAPLSVPALRESEHLPARRATGRYDVRGRVVILLPPSVALLLYALAGRWAFGPDWAPFGYALVGAWLVVQIVVGFRRYRAPQSELPLRLRLARSA